MDIEKKPLLIVLAILLLVFLSTTALILWPEMQYRRAVKKYPIGISLQEAKNKMPNRSSVSESGIVFPEPPTEEQKRTYPLYTVRLPEEGVYLEFNHYERLITVRSLGHPLWVWWSERAQQ